LGLNDLWVSRRACLACPWEDPVNLGPNINSDRGEGGANFSDDGHVMFFSSGRQGGHGAGDIWMSRRADPKDDLGWGPPVNLGPGVNTPTAEAGPAYRENAVGGPVLYFDRGMLQTFGADIYYVPITREGEIRGPAVLVTELSVPSANDAGVTIRADGREAFFWSFGPGRPQALGGGDLFRSTRKSVHDVWSPPELLDPPLNTEFGDIKPTQSFDGRTLLFWSSRPEGGQGAFDIWMSTRTSSGN
jgi:hypothetical protein